MPLVQSLDLLKRRVASPLFKTVLNDVHDKVRSGTALSDAFAAQDDLFPRVYTASLFAGERSGNLDAVLRRYVEYTKIIATVKRKTISALVYPAILISLAIVLVTIIVLKVVPAFSDFYSTFGANLPLVTRIIVYVSDFIRGQFIFLIVGIAAIVAAVVTWVRRPGQQARFDHAILQPADAGLGGEEIRDVADGPHARHPARRRAAAGERARHRRAVDREPVHGGAARHRERARAGRPVVRRGARRARRISRSGGENGGSRGVDRRTAGDAEYGRRFLRRRDLHDDGALHHARRADPPRRHGHRDCRSAAGALHAAVPIELRAVADTWPHRIYRPPPNCTSTPPTWGA